MFLPVLLFFAAVLLIALFMSIRISIELVAKNSGITYTVKGSIFKYINVVEVKSGIKKRKRENEKTDRKREKVLGLIKAAVIRDKGKIFHIEKLSLTGTFSIEDAAANAILYGAFIVLWQFILLILSANFKLEHQNYSFYPDYQNGKNELIFQAILRVVIFKVLLLLINYFIELKKQKKNKAE